MGASNQVSEKINILSKTYILKSYSPENILAVVLDDGVSTSERGEEGEAAARDDDNGGVSLLDEREVGEAAARESSIYILCSSPRMSHQLSDRIVAFTLNYQ